MNATLAQRIVSYCRANALSLGGMVDELEAGAPLDAERLAAYCADKCLTLSGLVAEATAPRAAILTTSSEHGFITIRADINGETVNATGATVEEATADAIQYVTGAEACAVAVRAVVAAYVTALAARITAQAVDGCYVDDLRAELEAIAPAGAIDAIDAYEIERDADLWEAEQAHTRAAENAWRWKC